MAVFSEKLMSARKAKGLTQEALAQMLNVSRQTVSHWENGRALPDLETTRRLTQLLGVDFIAVEQEASASASDPAADAARSAHCAGRRTHDAVRIRK